MLFDLLFTVFVRLCFYLLIVIWLVWQLVYFGLFGWLRFVCFGVDLNACCFAVWFVLFGLVYCLFICVCLLLICFHVIVLVFLFGAAMGLVWVVCVWCCLFDCCLFVVLIFRLLLLVILIVLVYKFTFAFITWLRFWLVALVVAVVICLHFGLF